MTKHIVYQVINMLLLHFLTVILLASSSLGFDSWDIWKWSVVRDEPVHYDFYMESGPWHSSDDWSSEEGIPSSNHRVAKLKDSETPSDCPPDESLLSKNDIIVMINYFQSEMNVIDNINSSYYPVAVQLRDKVFHSLEEIQKQLETRPGHIDHILEDIDDTKMKLEPIVDAIVSKLKELKIYEEKFVDVNNRAKDVLETLKKYKQLCQFNNCDKRTLMSRQNDKPNFKLASQSTDENYYCTSLKDLHQQIHTNLTAFEQIVKEVMKDTIERDNNIFEHMINTIKRDVKERALSMFRTTMYDILTLQDDYHQYADDLNSKADVNAQFNNIRKNTMQVDYKLMGLAEGVAKYHSYCLNCKPKEMSRKAKLWNSFINMPEQLRIVPLPEISNGPTQGLVGDELNIRDLIEDVLNGYRQVLVNDYRYIFEELNEVLLDPTLTESYVEKLKPIEEAVRNKLAVRQEALSNLKKKLPQMMVDQVYDLSKKSKQLLDNVQSAIDFVNKYA